MVQKVIRDRLDAILHWNISLVGGFLGAYAILLHAGNFGSAQTGNLMEMGAELVSMEWFDVLLRLAAHFSGASIPAPTDLTARRSL